MMNFQNSHQNNVPTDITIREHHVVPVFASGEEAFEFAALSTLPRALIWDEVESVSPCWLRAYNGDTPFYVPAFKLQAGDNSVVVVGLREGSELSNTHVLFVEPTYGTRMTVERFRSGKVEPTLLG